MFALSGGFVLVENASFRLHTLQRLIDNSNCIVVSGSVSLALMHRSCYRANAVELDLLALARIAR